LAKTKNKFEVTAELIYKNQVSYPGGAYNYYVFRGLNDIITIRKTGSYSPDLEIGSEYKIIGEVRFDYSLHGHYLVDETIVKQ